MLYDDPTETLIDVITNGVNGDGEPLTSEHLRFLSGLKGRHLEGGQFVAQVALSFIMGPPASEPWLPDIKRHGLECRVIDPDTAQEVVLHSGIRVASSTEESGTLLPVLREENEGRIEHFVRRRLLSDASERGPWVTYGRDTPRMLAPVLSADFKGERQALESTALESLARLELAIRPFQDDILAVEGEYAVEAVLLLAAVAKKLEERLDAEHGLIVAAPGAGPALVTAMKHVELGTVLAMWCRDQLASADGRRVSDVPILMQDGQAIGFIQVKRDSDPG